MQLTVEITNKQILRIALPIALSILVPNINFITNNIFLGHLSEEALAVAGITGVYYLVFGVMGFGLSNGLQALMSRRAGENKAGEIGLLFFQAVRIALAFAIAGIFITWFIAPFILKYSLHSKQDMQMAVGFLRIRIWGLPFLYIYQLRNALLISINKSKYLIIGALAETLANVFFDYAFIFGHFGFPELGFNGAAYASIIAEFTGLVTIFGVIHFKGIGKSINLFKNKKLHLNSIKLILHQSAPIVLQSAISVGSWEFFYILIEHHGTQALAISNIMRNLFGIFGCFAWSFASASNSMVSNIIGQKLENHVKELIYKISKLGLIFSIGIAILINLFTRFFLSAYGQNDGFINAAIPVARIISFALVLQSVSSIWLNAVLGTGNSRRNLITEIIAIVLYCLYVYTALEHFNLSITIGWMSEWLYWIAIFIPSYWYIQSNKWMGKKI
ncbi:MATE family efflux transporter [Parafilimonas sp.]|uniref:MATE family efflux transporter n=1 Tax=Parafilimonas sp. TaxID=1969739 RepID=UPI0039E41A31